MKETNNEVKRTSLKNVKRKNKCVKKTQEKVRFEFHFLFPGQWQQEEIWMPPFFLFFARFSSISAVCWSKFPPLLAAYSTSSTSTLLLTQIHSVFLVFTCFLLMGFSVIFFSLFWNQFYVLFYSGSMNGTLLTLN